MDSSTPNHSSHESLTVTPRTTFKRRAVRGSHERAAIDAILDEALVCHVGVVVDGSPRVMPTAHVRVGDVVYLHGSPSNRFLRAVAEGAQACITVTLLDGLVFARSAFHHSMNYRSAVIYGAGVAVDNPEEKRTALTALVEHMAQGRSLETRMPSDTELLSTLVVRVPIEEGSVKARSGAPIDDAADIDANVWSGVLPLQTQALAPLGDATVDGDTQVAASVAARAHAMHVIDMQPYEVTRDTYTISCNPARIDFNFVHRFLAEESYWARGVEAELQRNSMRHSLQFGLYEGNSQLGYARVVTDFGRVAYLADVFIASHARGRGLGKWLVSSVFAHPSLSNIQLFLLGTADAHSLYERHGFVLTPQGRMMVRRA